jgi:hypothetical protein
MIFLILGPILFILGFWMRSRFKRKDHGAGVEGMNAILVAATILTIFYGIINRLTIL